VKNTLTRRAASEAGAESLLALLEGPTAIAFVEADGDPVGVAKALSDTAKETKVLALRGGTLSGRSISGEDVEELAKLPAPEVIKSQLVGAIVAPLTQLVALVAAPLRDLVGLVDARIEQLGGVSADAEPLEEQAPVAAEQSVDEASTVEATAAGEAEGETAAAEGETSDPALLADSAPAESATHEEE